MRTEEELRAALAYYDGLVQRARAYWDEAKRPEDLADFRFGLYQEYKAAREALEWMLGVGVDEGRGDAPAHTAFPPDLKERGQ